MEANIMNEIMSEALTNVNVTIVVGLMAVGFIIKHLKFLEKIHNDLIPVIILVLSFVATYVDSGVSIASTIAALTSCAVAIGLHQTGKNIFTVTIVPKLVDVLGSTTNNSENTTNEEDQETKEK